MKKYYTKEEVKSILKEFISGSTLHKRGKNRLELAKKGYPGGLHNPCGISAFAHATGVPDHKIVNHLLKNKEKYGYTPDKGVHMGIVKKMADHFGFRCIKTHMKNHGTYIPRGNKIEDYVPAKAKYATLNIPGGHRGNYIATTRDIGVDFDHHIRHDGNTNKTTYIHPPTKLEIPRSMMTPHGFNIRKDKIYDRHGIANENTRVSGLYEIVPKEKHQLTREFLGDADKFSGDRDPKQDRYNYHNSQAQIHKAVHDHYMELARINNEKLKETNDKRYRSLRNHLTDVAGFHKEAHMLHLEARVPKSDPEVDERFVKMANRISKNAIAQGRVAQRQHNRMHGYDL